MQNPQIVGLAGLVLFVLGMLSGVLVYTSGASAEAIRLAAGTGVLFALGSSSLASAGLLRLEKRVKELEKQLASK